jgi:hypothetical protein
MDLENIAELIPRGGNKQHACASTMNVEPTIEVHLLVLRAIGWYGLLDFSPLSDKIC